MWCHTYFQMMSISEPINLTQSFSSRSYLVHTWNESFCRTCEIQFTLILINWAEMRLLKDLMYALGFESQPKHDLWNQWVLQSVIYLSTDREGVGSWAWRGIEERNLSWKQEQTRLSQINHYPVESALPILQSNLKIPKWKPWYLSSWKQSASYWLFVS